MENTNRKVRGVRANWYEKGKVYKMGSEYAGIYTPPVETQDGSGTLAPDSDHGFISYEYWNEKINDGLGGWYRTADFYGYHQREKFELAKENLMKLEVKA